MVNSSYYLYIFSSGKLRKDEKSHGGAGVLVLWIWGSLAGRLGERMAFYFKCLDLAILIELLDLRVSVLNAGCDVVLVDCTIYFKRIVSGTPF